MNGEKRATEVMQESKRRGEILYDIYTEDELGPVAVAGKVYHPKDGCVTIPSRKGEAVITLIKSSTNRRSWYYSMTLGKATFRYASLRQMEEALPVSLGFV